MIDICLVQSIQAKQAEAAYLTRVLELWAAAEAQGVDSSEGGSFGLNTRLLTPRQKVEWRRHSDCFVERSVTGASRPKLFNYFHRPDGRITILYPMLEAVYCESLT